MNVLHYGQSWDLGGPTVFHSPWWLREHWGRAFEIVTLRDGRARGDHGIVLLCRRPGTASAEELERPSDDPREVGALRFQVRQLFEETERLRHEAERRGRGGLRSRLGGLRRRVTS